MSLLKFEYEFRDKQKSAVQPRRRAGLVVGRPRDRTLWLTTTASPRRADPFASVCASPNAKLDSLICHGLHGYGFN